MIYICFPCCFIYIRNSIVRIPFPHIREWKLLIVLPGLFSISVGQFQRGHNWGYKSVDWEFQNPDVSIE